MNEGTTMATSMRPIRDTISLEGARALILESTRPLERTERITLSEASGRVLAASATSAHDVPPFDRAAMDGYAVRAEDTFGAGEGWRRADSVRAKNLYQCRHAGGRAEDRGAR